MKEFQAGRWDNAVSAFEKLTTDLPARDTLLPRSHWYLGRAHQRRMSGCWRARASRTSSRASPTTRWRTTPRSSQRARTRSSGASRRSIPTYGESAETAYNTLIGLFPNSPLLETGKKELADLEEMFAQKNYLSGMYYLRRKAHDSAIIYFKDVVAKYPTTPSARMAQLRLVDAYKAIRYKDDAADQCAELDEASRRRRGAGGRAATSRRSRRRRPPTRREPPRRRRALRPAEACASGSTAGASIRRTSATCSRSIDAAEQLELDARAIRARLDSAAEGGTSVGRPGRPARHDRAPRRRASQGSRSIPRKSTGPGYLTRLTPWQGWRRRSRSGARSAPRRRRLRPLRSVAGAGANSGARDDRRDGAGRDAIRHGRLPERCRCCRRGAWTSRPPSCAPGCADGRTIRGFVPDAVADYIAEHRLYR